MYEVANNELLKVDLNENDELVVNGRVLHEFLEANSNYVTWFKRMCKYGFDENIDYITCFPNLESEKQHGGQNKIDHILKIDMAKEISMIQRNEKGKKARQYFILAEKQLRNKQLSVPRVMKLADKRIEELEKEVEYLRKGFKVVKSIAEDVEK